MGWRDYDEDYTAADAKREEWEEKVESRLKDLVDTEHEKRTQNLTDEEWDELDEDALIEELRKEFQEDAEEAASESQP